MSNSISPARRTLLKKYKELKEEKNLDGVTAAPLPNNIMVWKACILGPPDTIWEGGIFHLVMEFPDDFPNAPPKVKFTTPIFHPNVYKSGDLCLDTIQKEWSDRYTILALLQSIRSLLNEPNTESPANSVASDVYKAYVKSKKDNDEYVKKVRECVEESIKLAQN